MEKNQILVSTWGYGQTNQTFYKVLGKTPSGKSVKIIELGQCVVKRHCSMSEDVAPDQANCRGKVMTKRLNDSGYIKISSYSIATPWDGEPMFQSHWN